MEEGGAGTGGTEEPKSADKEEPDPDEGGAAELYPVDGAAEVPYPPKVEGLCTAEDEGPGPEEGRAEEPKPDDGEEPYPPEGALENPGLLVPLSGPVDTGPYPGDPMVEPPDRGSITEPSAFIPDWPYPLPGWPYPYPGWPYPPG